MCLFNEYFIFQLNGEAVKKAPTKCCKIPVGVCTSDPDLDQVQKEAKHHSKVEHYLRH